MNRYDYLIVGAGLTGATLARTLTDAGQRVLVIDRRAHVAGNCYDEQVAGVWCNRHGGHIFHTNDARVWQFVQRFATWRQSQHRVKAWASGDIFSFPINLLTLQQRWCIETPNAARAWLDRAIELQPDPHANMEAWCLSTIGRGLYELFIEGYTLKQWGQHPRELPASIVRRIPVRLTFDDRYFVRARWEAQPEGGYTAFVARVLDGITVELGLDYIADRQRLDALATRTIYTGALDELYGYADGPLPYRSLSWEWLTHDTDTLGGPTINYCDAATSATRAISFAHFAHNEGAGSAWPVAVETPSRWEPGLERYYPLPGTAHRALYERYADQAAHEGVIVAGRLGRYQYLDMDASIAQALSIGAKLTGRA